jgi:DNA-binding FadR family transcriptional regulator
MVIAPLSSRELHELYAVRLKLDPEAASLAAQHATDRQLDDIVRLARKPTSAMAQTRLKANRFFHRSIYSSSGNELLTQLLDSLWDRTDRYRLLLLQDEELVDAAAREHVAIAMALKKRDSEHVAQLVYDHMAAAERLITAIGATELVPT